MEDKGYFVCELKINLNNINIYKSYSFHIIKLFHVDYTVAHVSHGRYHI